MKYKVVEITWDDAYHLTDSWRTLEEISESYKAGGYQVTSIGWIIFEDKKYVILASKRSNDFDSWGFIMMIPKAMITKRKNIK